MLKTFLVLLLAASLLVRAETPAGFEEALGPFFKEHCLRCHDEKKQKGDFRLDTLTRDFTTEASAQKWAEVMFRINDGEMPPEKEPQPKPDELGRVAGFLSARLDEGRAARMAKRGPIAHYRLSRAEYANTVYDLLGVYFDVEAPGALNEDPRWHGFERIGSMLSLSPSHVERYLKAAEAVLDQAFPAQPPKQITQLRTAAEIRYLQERKRIEDAGLADQVRVLMWPCAKIGGILGSIRESGVYRARIKLSGLPGLDGRAPHLSIWNDALKRSIYDEDIIAPEDKPIVVEFETFISMPVSLALRNEVPLIFAETGNHTLNVTDRGGSIFTSTRDLSRMNPTGYKLFDDERRALYPTLLVDSVEWEGPLVSEADQKKRDGLLPGKDADLAEARACLQRFAARAWRRPASEAELARYVKIIESELATGEKLPSAYRAAMVGVLSSKNFYYLEEGSATERRAKVTDWELASRLSYFLWGSMPDEALVAAAQAGQLHEPAVLRAQLQRMLSDPKINRFTEAFPQQWLQLYRVGVFPPDPKLYPDYDAWLEKSMVLETKEVFRTVFAQNLPLREFIASDWTMVNPRLAQHYKMPPLHESGFQKVALRPEDHRGGLLTEAGILMLTSDGTRHRPVHRGVWLSEAIFGKTPPPPPPNVQPIEPIPTDKPKATVRMQLEAHATEGVCISCHQKIDGLGFAFENYDALGQWRTEEIVPRGRGANPPVNATGTLPNGRSFQSPEEFKSLLCQETDRFAEAFVEQLSTFALRRVMTMDDAAQIKAIASASKQSGYPLRTVIENLVTSELFQKR